MMVETLSGANIEQLGCWDHRGVTFLQHPELWERWGQRNHENCQQYFKMSHLSRMELFFGEHLSWFYWEDHLNRQIFRWESWAQRAVWDSLVASNVEMDNPRTTWRFWWENHPTQWDIATFHGKIMGVTGEIHPKHWSFQWQNHRTYRGSKAGGSLEFGSGALCALAEVEVCRFRVQLMFMDVYGSCW